MKPGQKEFEAYYRKLNPQQRLAVDTVEGPVMVAAGPGTGKTQVLTLRIANILLTTDTEPSAILALTFTESGAAAMRRRLAGIIGPAAYRLSIGTFHSFCNGVIQQYPEYFSQLAGASPITDGQQIELMREIVETESLTELRTFGDPYFYVRPCISAIDELKREGITPEKFRALVKKERDQFAHTSEELKKSEQVTRAKHLARNTELATVYDRYQTRLTEQRLYDWNDMIVQVMLALETQDDLRLILQERYQYILVDEHQDTNGAQQRVAQLLASFYENPNLFVVGDEKQAIFRFQGASLENFFSFKKHYPSAVVIDLQHNYRSRQQILDNAHRVAGRGTALVSATGKTKDKNPVITVREYTNPLHEAQGIARDIRERLAETNTLAAHEIAVLYRDNKDALAISQALEREGVPYIVESDQDVLRDDDIRKLLLLIRTVANLGDEVLLAQALHIDFLRVPVLDMYRLINDARTARTNIFALLTERQPALAEQLEHWHRVTANTSAAMAIETIAQESGFVQHLLTLPDAPRKLAKLRTLYDQIANQMESDHDLQLSGFLQRLAIMEAHGAFLKSPSHEVVNGRVRLMTAHRSKGQEFDVVYIVGLTDGHWGNRRSQDYFHITELINTALTDNDSDDDRNLFYVALTRARQRVLCSWAHTSLSGRTQLPSAFITELDPVVIASEVVPEAPGESVITAPVSTAPKPTLEDKAYLNDLFERYGLSVTALNHYLQCPWKYFYVNLIRLPQAPNRHMLYGNTIHFTLKEFFDAWTQGERRTREDLVAIFERYAHRQAFSQTELNDVLAKGREALLGYYEQYHATWTPPMINELRIEGIEIAGVDGSSVRLNGAIDRMEILPDGVAVRDYKTGKPKTRGQVEGTTADSNGDYLRQLVFYNLLLNRYENGKHQMKRGVIDFIEPDDRGRYHQEEFVIVPQRVAELGQQIIQVADEIRSLAFWDRICDDKDCEFCALRKTKGTP